MKMNNSNSSTYFFHLSHDFVNFRLPELESVSEIINQPGCLTNSTYTDETPMFTCDLNNDQIAIDLANRSAFIKSVSKLWCQSNTFEDLLTQIENKINVDLSPTETFKIDFTTFSRIYSQRDKILKIEKIVDALKIPDCIKVCLKDSEVTHRFTYFEEWIQVTGKKQNENYDLTTDGPIQSETNESTTGNEKYLRQCYFGKFVCDGLNGRITK